jgi:hypothetical protein
VTTYFTEDELVRIMSTIGFQVDGGATHIFSSALSRWARETFIRRPYQLLPLLPVFRGLVAVGDRLPAGAHGQIIVLSAARPAAPLNGNGR